MRARLDKQMGQGHIAAHSHSGTGIHGFWLSNLHFPGPGSPLHSVVNFYSAEEKGAWEAEVPHFSEKGREMWEFMSRSWHLSGPRFPHSLRRAQSPSPQLSPGPAIWWLCSHLEAPLSLGHRTLAAGIPPLLGDLLSKGTSGAMDVFYLTGSCSRLLV